MTKKNGRPSIYTEALAGKICEQIAAGQTLTKICKEKAMPGYRTVLDWRTDNPAFKAKYEAAREDAADTLADEIRSIARRCLLHPFKIDPEGGKLINEEWLDEKAARVAIDALKWTASKLKPKTYGDRIEQHFTGGSDLLDAMDELGKRGLPGDNAKLINGSATELPPDALPSPKKMH